MKNVHVLPTDKPSRLSDCHNGKLHLDDVRYLRNYQNIYITSDEEIKEGNWVLWLSKNKIIKCEDSSLRDRQDMVKKIILTTDVDLIKDGVQAIEDEFLEWFVKNPSCEEVEVHEQYRKCCRNTDGKNENCLESINCEGWLNNDYERPYKTNCDKRFEGYKIIIPKEEPKQETLEEVVERLYPYEIGYGVYDRNCEIDFERERFIEGAKWQQEQDNNKYIVDLKTAFTQGFNARYRMQNGTESLDKFIEQFKKK